MTFKLKFKPGRHAAALGISYKPSTPKDMTFLKRVYRSTREAELEMTGWDESQKASFIDMQFNAQHTHYQEHYPEALWLVVRRKDKRIGRLYIEEWPSELRIIDIALLTIERGKGLGAAILLDINELASDKNKKVGIHVEKNNPAMRLYMRLGFTRSEDAGDVYDLMHWHSAG